MLRRLTRKQISSIPAVLALVAVAIGGALLLEDPAQRIFAWIVEAVFAAVMFFPMPRPKTDLKIHIRLGILTVLAAMLLRTNPGWNFFPILFFVLAPMAMVDLPARAGWTWIGGFILVTAVVYYIGAGLAGLGLVLPFAAGYVFFGSFGRLLVESDKSRARSEQLLSELQEAHRQLKEYAARVEELSVTQERNRIAREMHDTLGHRLTIAAVQLEGAQRLIPTNPERAAAMVGTVREQVKEGLTDLRRTVAMLRASVEEDLPLEVALARLVEGVRQATTLKIHLSLEDCPPDLALPQHQALYRAAQEGLTNIQRHANASEAWIQLTNRDGMIRLLVSDNGVGLPPEAARAGFGLTGLKERAELQGGEFHIDPRPGGGTQLTFCIPAGAPQVSVEKDFCGGEHE